MGFFVGLPLHALGVSLAKKDAQMIVLLVRSLWARDSYPPHGAVRTRASAVRPSIPGAR
jgi:hypothetical protein